MPPSEVTRISVPAIENWSKVQQNINDAILAALYSELPSGKDDTRRDKIEKELMAWKDSLFEMAKPNLRVNGVDFEVYQDRPKYQPFDEALDRTVRALREQSLVSEQTIADRRRTVPAKVQDLLKDLLERQRAAEMPLAEDEDVEVPDGKRDDLSGLGEQAKQLQQDTMETEEAARELNTTVPRLLQRAQWAQEVSAELNSTR